MQWHCNTKLIKYFNPHSREGSDRLLDTAINILCSISIHTPAKGVTWALLLGRYLVSYFNPHSREGSDGNGIIAVDYEHKISIHTPAKGVTGRLGNHGLQKDYFNPHSREGSDAFCFAKMLAVRNFNPHSREGSDDTYRGQDVVVFEISIHTPAKGVTKISRWIFKSFGYFNPHSREGSD